MPDQDPTPVEEQVRRLLADARHDEPMPADIADRIDGVLAGLRDESRRTPAPVDLAARRRRRIARNVLVAAAAVVVLGVGVSQVDLSGQSADDAGSTASRSTADSGAGSALESAPGDVEAPGGRPLVLRSEEFDQLARRLSRQSTQESLEDPTQELDSGLLGARTWCDDPAWGSGQRIAVRYDGKRGVLVLRAPSGGSRVADLYLCGESVPTRSATVPAP